MSVCMDKISQSKNELENIKILLDRKSKEIGFRRDGSWKHHVSTVWHQDPIYMGGRLADPSEPPFTWRTRCKPFLHGAQPLA